MPYRVISREVGARLAWFHPPGGTGLARGAGFPPEEPTGQ